MKRSLKILPLFLLSLSVCRPAAAEDVNQATQRLNTAQYQVAVQQQTIQTLNQQIAATEQALREQTAWTAAAVQAAIVAAKRADGFDMPAYLYQDSTTSKSSFWNLTTELGPLLQYFYDLNPIYYTPEPVEY